MSRPRHPLRPVHGAPIRWTALALLAQALPTPADRQAAQALWTRYAPPLVRGILHAQGEPPPPGDPSGTG